MFLIKRTKNMQRKLPCWMKAGHPKTEFTPSASKSTTLQNNYPNLELPSTCEIIYSYNISDCSLLCRDIRTLLSTPTVMCLDTEWATYPQISKTSLIQICTSLDRCYVFQVSAMDRFPPLLKEILENKNSILTGINLAGDLWKLCRDYDVCCEKVQASHFLDLQKMAKRILNRKNQLNLSSLCMTFLQKQISKEQQKSNWNAVPLLHNQLNYAALDAYSNLLLYQKIFPLTKDRNIVNQFSKCERNFLLNCHKVLA